MFLVPSYANHLGSEVPQGDPAPGGRASPAGPAPAPHSRPGWPCPHRHLHSHPHPHRTKRTAGKSWTVLQAKVLNAKSRLPGATLGKKTHKTAPPMETSVCTFEICFAGHRPPLFSSSSLLVRLLNKGGYFSLEILNSNCSGLNYSHISGPFVGS